MSRLLSSFHTTVAEITIIATPDSEAGPDPASKTVQMRSFNDPAKGDSTSFWGGRISQVEGGGGLRGPTSRYGGTLNSSCGRGT